MTEIFFALCYLATFALLVGGAAYLFVNRQEAGADRTAPPPKPGSVADLQGCMVQLASSNAGAYLAVELAATQDSLLITKDDRGINLQFDPKSQGEDFIPKLRDLAAREGLTLLEGSGFPEINLSVATMSPESITYRLFRGAYNAEDSDSASFSSGTV